MTISYLFRYLWKKRWLILIPTLAALLAAWFFTRNQPQTYTSTAEISTGYMELDPLDTRNINNNVLFNNVIQTLQSSQILDQVCYRLLLHDIQGNMPFLKVSDSSRKEKLIAQYPGGKNGLITTLYNKADSFYVLNLAERNDRIIRELADLYGYSSDMLLNKVQIKRIEGSDFIKVEATTRNADLSAFIPNTICKTFLAYYQNKQGRSSSSSIDTLRGIMETKKQLLDNKLSLLKGGGDFLTSNTEGMIGNLQSMLTQQKNNLIAAQVALDNVNKQISTASSQGGLSDNEDIISLRNKIDNLWAKYVNSGSKDVSLLNQINDLRSELQQKLSAVGGTSGGVSVGDLMKQKLDLEVKVNVASQTMKDLEKKINSLNNIVQTSASKEGVVQSLRSEIDVAREEYANASKLYNDALNRTVFAGNNFKQTLIANPSLYPNPSEKLKVIGLSGTGVFFLLIFVLLFLEFIDPSIKGPSSLKETIPFPLLANLERINVKSYPVESIFSANGSLPPREKGFREQVKQLRYEVETSGSKVFLLAGYHISTGRTTLIKAISQSLSLKGRKVLMIDVNFQHNTLSQQYNTEVLLEDYPIKGDKNNLKGELAGIVVPTEDENIGIIGCGSSTHTPDEILPERNVLSYLKDGDTGFDYVFIDCAPLSHGPDCKELLKYVDAVILVYAADQTLTEEDRKFAEFLKREQVDITGVVLNKTNSYYKNI